MSHITRRKFIRMSCLACAAIPLMPLIPEQTFKSVGPINFDREGGYLVPVDIAEMIYKKMAEIDAKEFIEGTGKNKPKGFLKG